MKRQKSELIHILGENKLKTYIFKTKKYIIAQILWDLAGGVCLAISPLLQQWLFDYGLERSFNTILCLIVAYFALLFFYTLSQYFCILFAFKGGIKFEKLLKRDFISSVFHMESGSGKSTLLKLIMGYEKTDSGTIKIDGDNIRKYDISELISYVDQNEHIYRAGIEDNITVFRTYDINDISSAKGNIQSEMFEELFQREEKECQCFSGGEKQAVAFLRMVAKKAEIILMDEPFSAMDVKTKSAVERYLFTAKEFKDKTILVVTHDTREESLSWYDGIIHVEDRIYCTQ